jgi:hypothetical protein
MSDGAFGGTESLKELDAAGDGVRTYLHKTRQRRDTLKHLGS